MKLKIGFAKLWDFNFTGLKQINLTTGNHILVFELCEQLKKQSASNNDVNIRILENIDRSMHHSYQYQMWHDEIYITKKYEEILIATTQSIDCVRAYSEVLSEYENAESFATFHRIQEKNGKIEDIQYTLEELAIALSQEIEVR